MRRRRETQRGIKSRRDLRSRPELLPSKLAAPSVRCCCCSSSFFIFFLFSIDWLIWSAFVFYFDFDFECKFCFWNNRAAKCKLWRFKLMSKVSLFSNWTIFLIPHSKWVEIELCKLLSTSSIRSKAWAQTQPISAYLQFKIFVGYLINVRWWK